MLRTCSCRLGGAGGRRVAGAAAGVAPQGRAVGRVSSTCTNSKPVKRTTKTPPAHTRKLTAASALAMTTTRKTTRTSSRKATASDAASSETSAASSARPAYMSAEREKEVLSMAERMQSRDLSGDVPVASFAYDIILKHPSVRTMGLRERMDFLCTRWSKLPEKKRLEYLNDPLKGLL